jgi:hypothetical protein
VYILARRVVPYDVLQPFHRSAILAAFLEQLGQAQQKADMKIFYGFPADDSPVLVAILRQERADVCPECGLASGDVRREERPLRTLHETIYVNLHTARVEEEQVVGQPETRRRPAPGNVRLESTAGAVQRLAEAGECRLRTQVGPEDFEYLVAVELVARIDCEELHERPGFRTIPLGIRHRLTVALDRKSAEQAYRDGSGYVFV